MRTKKILSIVLAFALTLGVFSAVGASAAEDRQVQGTVAVQAAASGWADASFVSVSNNASAAGSIDAAVLEWEAFTADTNNTPSNGYFSQKALPATGSQVPAKIVWSVTYYPGGKAITITPKTSAVLAALDNIQVFVASTSTKEQLYIKQGKVPYYGKIEVTATVTAYKTSDLTPVSGVLTLAAGATQISKTSSTVTINLLDKAGYYELITAVDNMLKQKDRYKESYLKDLTAVKNAFKLQLDSIDPNSPNADTILKESKALLEAKKDEPKAGKFGKNGVMKLTGVNFLDDMSSDSFKLWCWTVNDFFTNAKNFFDKLSAGLEPMSKLFTSLFTTFTFLLPLLKLLIPGL